MIRCDPKTTFNLGLARVEVWAWKGIVYGGAATAEAQAFTSYGYSGADPSATAMPAYISPGNKIPAERGDFVWEPNKPFSPGNPVVGKHVDCPCEKGLPPL
jgi:hypothetical protein